MRLFSLLSLAALLLSLTTSAWAKRSYFVALTTSYTLAATANVAKASCTLCHPGGDTSQFDQFGTDARKAMAGAGMTAAAIAKLGLLDSDADGYTNDEELKADTLPNDATKTPAKVLTVTRTAALTKAEDVAAALDKAPWIALGPTPLAQVRLGVAGDNLAIEVKVPAAWITADLTTWDVTTIQLAAAPSVTAPDLSVLSVALKGPGVGEVALSRKGVAQPVPALLWTASALKEGGIAFSALVPLKVLGADPATKSVLFDIGATVPSAAGGKTGYASLFRTSDGFKDARRFGTLTMQEPVPATP
jgi:hypothetical protein